MSIDYDLPTTPDTAQATDGPQTDARTATPNPPHTTTRHTPAVQHTEGGWPALPLLLITSNTAVAGLSAAALVAGPAAAAALAAGTGVTAAAAAARTRAKTRSTRTNQPRRTQPTPRSRTQNGSGGAAGRTSTRNATPSAGSAAGSRRSPATSSRSGGMPAARPSAAKTPSRVQRVRSLRKDRAAAAATTGPRAARQQTTAARRNVADARRAARNDAKLQRRNAAGTGGGLRKAAAAAGLTRTAGAQGGKTSPAPRAAAGKGGLNLTKNTPTGTASTKTSPGANNTTPATSAKRRPAQAVIDKTRISADKTLAARRDRIRRARLVSKSRVRLAGANARARTRHGMSAVKAGLIAAPFAALGVLSTPLGRKLGWRWMQAPGPRIYRRLMTNPTARLHARLADARDVHYATITNGPNTPTTTDPDAEQPGTTPAIAGTVQRAPRTGAAPTLTGDDMSEAIQSEFLNSSEELVAAANSYEPGGMMHVRMTIQAMPLAIHQWAQAFGILAQKTDDDFPLDSAVGEGLEDLHQKLMSLVNDAEELGQTFDRVHEDDIRRIREPRKSAEAEKTWDTGANEDYDTD